MALPTIYKTPTIDWSKYTQGAGKIPFGTVWDLTGQQYRTVADLLSGAQGLLSQGYTPYKYVKAYAEAQDPMYYYGTGELRKEWQPYAEAFGGKLPTQFAAPGYADFTKMMRTIQPNVNAEQVWMAGADEIQRNIQNYQNQMARTQRIYQEGINWLRETGTPGTPQYQDKLAQIQRYADDYNRLAQGLAGITGETLTMGEAPGVADTSGMLGGTRTEALGMTAQQPVDVDAWRASQGLPTTAQMQAPGYQAPPTGAPIGGPGQLTPQGTPITQPTAPGMEGLGEQIRDPADLALYREEDIVRMPDGRIFLKAGVAPRGMPGTTPTPGVAGTTGGTRIPSPEYLKYYSENEIIRNSDGSIYLKPGVPIRWGGAQGELPGATATEDLTQFALGMEGLPNLAEGTPYGDIMNQYTQALASLNKPITEIQNKILDTLMNRPSTVATLQQLKDTYGVNALNAELTRLAKAAAPLEEALEKLPEDIKDRYKDVGISEAHTRRRLALEAKPLTESINKITKARNLTLDQLKTNKEQIAEIMDAIVADQEKEDSFLQTQLEFATDSMDQQKAVIDSQLEIAMSQIAADIEAKQPDISVEQFTDNYGNVTMVGIDQKTGEEVWRNDLGNVSKMSDKLLEKSSSTPGVSGWSGNELFVEEGSGYDYECGKWARTRGDYAGGMPMGDTYETKKSWVNTHGTVGTQGIGVGDLLITDGSDVSASGIPLGTGHALIVGAMDAQGNIYAYEANAKGDHNVTFGRWVDPNAIYGYVSGNMNPDELQKMQTYASQFTPPTMGNEDWEDEDIIRAIQDVASQQSREDTEYMLRQMGISPTDTKWKRELDAQYGEGTTSSIPSAEQIKTLITPYKDAGWIREDVERQIRADLKIGEDEALPTPYQMALDEVYGGEKSWWQEFIERGRYSK